MNFSGIVTNLHAAWDSSMPEKLVGGYGLPDAHRWATTLTEAIRTGIYKTQAQEWLAGIDLADPAGSALVWASQANAFVCTAVLPKGADAVRGQELSGDYYEASVPVIQLQIARAGYR